MHDNTLVAESSEQEQTKNLLVETLAEQIKSATDKSHQQLDERIMAYQPFTNLERYKAFLKVQYGLHYVTSPIFNMAEIRAWFPEIESRCRLNQIEQDCRDVFGDELDLESLASTVSPINFAPETALGWLYTVEGSNLGAAFLFKFAQKNLSLSETYGAAHLSGHSAPRGLQWRNFKTALNSIKLNASEKDSVFSGAIAAFSFVRARVETYMPLVDSQGAEGA